MTKPKLLIVDDDESIEDRTTVIAALQEHQPALVSVAATASARPWHASGMPS